jgi:hypothetical protein
MSGKLNSSDLSLVLKIYLCETRLLTLIGLFSSMLFLHFIASIGSMKLWSNKFVKLFRVNVYKGSDNIISSPELYAGMYRGGRLGMVGFNQGDVLWTALDVKCRHL